MKDTTPPFNETTQDIILKTVSGYNFSVTFDFYTGHGTDNHALILGLQVQLSVAKIEPRSTIPHGPKIWF
ncbi:MAG: hypothetical protein ABI045_06855 [Flavobacteriales bacterium]